MSSRQRPAAQSIHNKKFWTEFFQLYESLPALWDFTNPVYKNRQVKSDAYDILVNKLRELEPMADREDVLRKINIFRTNYRRECSRINQSLQDGRPYKSTLWYFELLLFLHTTDARKAKKLEVGGEKCIMGKRRTLVGLSKHSDTVMIETKKGDIIEYQPNSSHTTDMDYDNYEDSNFDYVGDLSQSMEESKSERPLQIPIEDYHDLEDDEGNSQNDYDHDEFQDFAIQTNESTSLECNQNEKKDVAMDPIDEEDSGSMINSNGQMLRHYDYDNETSAEDENGELFNRNESTTAKFHDEMKTTTKMVRNATTMTSDGGNISNCSGKLSNPSEIIAKSWAIQYDEMSQEQKILARKAINDILFDGCMGRLTTDSNGHVVKCKQGKMGQTFFEV